MRVLFVTPMFPNKRNIQQGIFVRELALALKGLGHDVRVASVEPALPWPLPKLKRYRRKVAQAHVPHYEPIIRHEVTQWPRNWGVIKQSPHLGRHLIRLIEFEWGNWHPDIIHSHTLFPGALIAEPMCHKWSVKQLVTSHGGDTRTQIHRKAPQAEIKRLITSGIHVVGVGDWIVDCLSPWAQNENQLRCIYNGLDFNKLRPARQSLRDHFAERKLVLGMGNLINTKGYDILIKSFEQLKNDYPQWDLAIVGGGREENSLKKLAASLHLSSRITFTGPLTANNAMEWMDLCEIFCLPSWSEGFGVVYIEAMACGKPVIAVDGQGITSVVKKNDVGLLVKPKNIASTTYALRTLMDNAQLRKEIGERGRSLTRREFSWNDCASQYVQLYCNLA